MRAKSYAGYRLTARRPASSAAVEHWWAEGPDGPAEVYLGPEMLLRRARALPVWGPFAGIITGQQGLRSFVVVRGRMDRSVDDLRRMMSPGACVAFAWHLAAALAEVHEQGGAHGALHPGWTGLDTEGRLTVRPALTAAVRGEPDGDATAQATDCIQLASILEALDLERIDEPALSLMMRGISRDRSRLRLQPGRAVRQSLSYILNRHAEWETALVETLGPDWNTSLLPRAMPLPEPVERHPWNEHGTHIPRVGPSTSSSLTATVDVLAATARTAMSSDSGTADPRDAPEASAGSRARASNTGQTSASAGVRVMVRKASASVRPVTNRPAVAPSKRRAAESASYARSVPAAAAPAVPAAASVAAAVVSIKEAAAAPAAAMVSLPTTREPDSSPSPDASPSEPSAAVSESATASTAEALSQALPVADAVAVKADAGPSVMVPEMPADLETATGHAHDPADATGETAIPEDGESTAAAEAAESQDSESSASESSASESSASEPDAEEAPVAAVMVEPTFDDAEEDDDGTELESDGAQAEGAGEDEPEVEVASDVGSEGEAVASDNLREEREDAPEEQTFDEEPPAEVAEDHELEALDADASLLPAEAEADSVDADAEAPEHEAAASSGMPEIDEADPALVFESESVDDPGSAAPALASLLAHISNADRSEPTVDTVAPLASLSLSDPATHDQDSVDEVFEDDEQTAVTTVPEPVRQALERLNAGRGVRDLTAEPAPEAIPPAVVAPSPQPAFPSPPVAAPPSAVASDYEMPRWAGIKGVTGDASREDELGSGKWEEEARPLSELRREMGQEPVREMEHIGPSRGNWPMLLLFLAGLFSLIGLWLYTQTGLFNSAG